MQHKLGNERTTEIDKLVEMNPLLRESVEGYLQFPSVPVFSSSAQELTGLGSLGKGFVSGWWQTIAWVSGGLLVAGVVFTLLLPSTAEQRTAQKAVTVEPLQLEESSSLVKPLAENSGLAEGISASDSQAAQLPEKNLFGIESIPLAVAPTSLVEELGPVFSAEQENELLSPSPIPSRTLEELSYNMILVREYNNEQFPIGDLVRNYNNGLDDELRILHISNFKIVDYSSFRKELWPKVVLGGVPASNERAVPSEKGALKELDYLGFIENGIYGLVKQDYAFSLGQFGILLEEYPEDVNGLFYTGLAFYYSENYTKAREFFKKAELSRFRTFHEESEFYSALSILALGNKEQATEELLNISARRGFYGKQALQILREKK
jgi:hypothetical protein